MLTVEILKGLPASGKTTYAKEKVARSNCAIKRVNKDDLRAMLDSGRHSKGNERYVLQLRDNIILTALDLGKSVIVDDTNFNIVHEERIRELVKDFNAGLYGERIPKNPVQVNIKHFHILPEEAIARDLQRPNSVGAKVIWNMHNTYIKKEDPKKAPIIMEQDESLPHAIICDLDGTIALKGNRSAYDETKVSEDTLNVPIADLVKSLFPNFKIIFLSARTDSCKEDTIEWLKKYGLLFDNNNFQLHMRKTGDNRKDRIVKQEIFDAHIKGKYYIKYVLDDRNQVVDLWRSMGLTCLQVADGNF